MTFFQQQSKHDIYLAKLFTTSPCVHRVSELCDCIEAVSGEKAEDQVLLTADGRQMDPRELIGSYSVGTVGFYPLKMLAFSPSVAFHGRRISHCLCSTGVKSAPLTLPTPPHSCPRVGDSSLRNFLYGGGCVCRRRIAPAAGNTETEALSCSFSAPGGSL